MERMGSQEILRGRRGKDMSDLATKYRPKSWQEVVGQQAIISILQRQVANKAWKNTYLFVGPHGCGKTTVARILANEINSGQGSPIEIDAASNSSIENMRGLIADSQQCPIDCDYKVYIIDEAHQLRRPTWDAALKLIEEPPEFSIFIFCTTEFKKIPSTILSRVQTFEFKRVDKSVIADRLEFILNEEVKRNYERVALERIASLANGHVRDAVKYLDRCLDAVDKLTLENVEATLGLVRTDSFNALIECIINKDLNGCLNELMKIKSYNSDMLVVMDEFISFALDCSLYVLTKNYKAVMLPKEVCEALKDSDVYGTFAERLISYRKFADSFNAEVLIKTVIKEMCK